MPVETISLSQFEEALSQINPGVQNLGIEQGEYTFFIPLDARTGIKVRSSIDNSGISAECGDDSIRCWLVYGTGEPLGAKVDRLTKRTKGWEGRLSKKIDLLIDWRQRTGDCPECGEPCRIFKVKKNGKNKGRPFAKCRKHSQKTWKWLDEEEKNDSHASATKKQIPLAHSGRGARYPLQDVNNQQDTRSMDTSTRKLHTDTQDTQETLPTVLDFLSGEDAELALPFDDIEVAGRIEKIPQPIEPDTDIILNAYQQQAVDALAVGPQVIEACPGSGKTRLLENLVAELLKTGADPDRIGFFTFSNPAASEARRRVARTIFPDATPAELAYFEDPTQERRQALGMGQSDYQEWASDPRRRFILERVCTIHALANRLLKWSKMGKQLSVPSGKMQWKLKELIRDTLDELKWEESPKSVEKWIGLAINNLVLPEQSESWFAQQFSLRDGPVWNAGKMAEVYRRRQDFMKAHNLICFDMMIARVIWLLNNNPQFAEWTKGLLDYVLVDEAQDTNPMQSEILFCLAERTGNVVYTGDTDQALYAFRNANPAIMRQDFEARWPQVRRFNLPINYRSTKAIIDASTNLILNNYRIDDKYIKPFQSRDNAPEGEPVEFIQSEKFDGLCDEIIAEIANDGNPGDWYILSRTRAECAAIHTKLLAARIPAINKSGGLLFGSKHIRKVVAYLRLACNYDNARNSEEILSEIANVASAQFRAPMTRRRHDKGCYAKPWQHCGCPIIREEGVDYSHARYYGRKALEKAGHNWDKIREQQWGTNRGGYPTVQAKGATDLVRFVDRLDRIKDDAEHCLNVIIQDCVLPWIQHEEGLTDDDLAENGKGEDFTLLLQLCEPEMTAEEYLNRVDELSSGTSTEDDANSVHVGTFHWSKGSERPKVIVNLTRCPIVPPKQVKGKLPTGSPPSIDEERRLAFVGGTRAEVKLIVGSAREWNNQGVEISQFVGEMGLTPKRNTISRLTGEPLLEVPSRAPGGEFDPESQSPNPPDTPCPYYGQEVPEWRRCDGCEQATECYEEYKKSVS